jgi:signal transduction histidine kinase
MGADSGGLLPPMLIPFKKETTHRDIYEASFKQEPEYHKIWNGKALENHYTFLRTIPSVAKAIKVMEDSGLTLPEQQCYYVGFFKHGYLLLITKEPSDNLIELSKRFAQVFDLTYTRFLDLQLKERQSVALIAEKQRLEKTLSDLQTTQKQLIQSEKMASLGELTAGIAHEIQNPLNFVNNFSEVSNELLDEMEEEMQNGNYDEAKELLNDIKQNLEKINTHGKRADGIVKGMLQHSRKSSAEKEPTDINKLADEYLRLAYHGLRAKDKSFNATLETDFDETIGKINVIPQDIGRVILNLITNAFYACSERSGSTTNERKASDDNYKPTVSVSTKKEKYQILISVKDNGNGIPKHVLDKIFQPFFTTKPTGQGTGLGLSMSYDIVTKAHGGELKVETKEGLGTTFIITIPK